MVDAVHWHEKLRYLSETVLIVYDFRNWSFTIYRTAYGPSTDQQCQQLLEKIHTKAHAATSRVCQATADDLRSHRLFLLADEEVLSDADAFLVKCVEADYEAANHVPRNTWQGGQWYFGWMPLRSAEIVELWLELEYEDLQRIAPRTVAARDPDIGENMGW
jgi:hypothetical protein